LSRFLKETIALEGEHRMIGQIAESREGWAEPLVTIVHRIAVAARTTGRDPLSIQSQEKTMSRGSFEEVVLPHLDAAFNYARWLTKIEADAEDVVQDAYVRALRFFSSLRGEDARAWLLTIVRHTWYGRFPRRAGSPVMTDADEDADNRADASPDPEAQLIQQQGVEEVRRALETLPTYFREVLVLRELEGLSYKEIVAIVGIPLGTVMSRLARARDRLASLLTTSGVQLRNGLL
jgi:RNA polymerase sigma-70 factor (ECF subfamily)